MTATHAVTAPACADIAAFLPLVRRMAGHLKARLPAQVEHDDLVQAGLIGLNGAMGRFDAARGVPFEAFAAERIRGAMLDELRANDWASRSDRANHRAAADAVQRLEHHHGRTPTAGEVAAELDLSLAEYQRQRTRLHREFVPLDELGDSSAVLSSGTAGDPLARLTDRRMREALVQAIERLPERGQLVMSLLYDQGLTAREAAAVLGVTESRVSQLHSRYVAALRAALSSGWLSAPHTTPTTEHQGA
jgi:RNA polymerase sigma factor for flagellar operon FliA